MNRHIILRQQLEITVADTTRAGAVQAQLGNELTDAMKAEMERVFSRFAGDDRYIRLPRVTVDLGRIPENQLREQLVQRIGQALQAEMTRLLETQEQGGMPNPPIDLQQDEVAAIPVVRTETMHAWEAFYYFLQFGALPWWSAWATLPELEKRLLDALTEEINRPAPPAWPAALRERVLYRLAAQCSLPLLAALTIAWQPAAAGVAAWWMALPALAAVWKLPAYRLRPELGAAIFSELPQTPRSGSGQPDPAYRRAYEVFDQLVQRLDRLAGESPDLLLLSRHAALPAALRPVVSAWSETNASARQAHKSRWSDLAERPGSTVSGKTEIQHSNPGLVPGPLSASEKNAGSDAEALFVQSAGLVLLHPFLPELFRALDWLEETHFKNEACRHRAVHLTGWLAGGAETQAEPGLALAKILCGLPIAAPIPRFLDLETTEKEQGLQLLAAVIGHWKALGNTGVEGLREGFLQREGKFSRAGEQLRLIVENKTQDILLDKLPWGFSMIRLPWMPELLRVDWN